MLILTFNLWFGLIFITVTIMKMKMEIRVIVIVLVIASILGAAVGVIRLRTSEEKFVLPFSRSMNVFSLVGRHEKPKKLIYGYLPYWSIIDADYLQLDKLTDIAYFGLYIEEDGNIRKTTTDEDGYTITEPGYNNWKSNKDLDNLISWSKRYGIRFSLTIIAHEDDTNTKFLNCRECWDTLLVNVIDELNSKNITDLNLNFEYAEHTSEEDSKKFAELTRYFNEELDKVYGDSFLVVSAFADSTEGGRISSDVADLAKYSDGIFIMGYDYSRPTSDNAGPVAPIKWVDDVIKDFLSYAPPSKIILGVPYYGYNWVVEDGSEKYAKRVEGTDEIGFSTSQSYDSVMETIKEVNPTILVDEESNVPYFFYTSPETESLREVFYENAQSLRAKYDLVNNNNLAGVGIWALGYDGGRTELWDLLYESFIR